MKRILVIGATGNIGREVVTQLTATGASVRAMARDPETAGLPPGVEAVRGDLTEAGSLDACLEGVDAVFLVWIAPAEHVGPAVERMVRKARRIVFLSSPYKTQHPLFQGGQPNSIATLHAEIERLIAGSGREWTFLRPGMLNSNARNWWAPAIRAGGVVRWPYLEAPTAPIDERDIAAVAVRTLCDDGHAGAEYVLTGPESLSQRAQIAAIGDAIGSSIRVEEIPAEEAPRELVTYFPEFVAKLLLGAWAATMGHPALVTSTVEEITGVPARRFRDWAAHHAAEFAA